MTNNTNFIEDESVRDVFFSVLPILILHVLARSNRKESNSTDSGSAALSIAEINAEVSAVASSIGVFRQLPSAILYRRVYDLVEPNNWLGKSLVIEGAARKQKGPAEIKKTRLMAVYEITDAGQQHLQHCSKFITDIQGCIGEKR